jgi:hypothetical protein
LAFFSGFCPYLGILAAQEHTSKAAPQQQQGDADADKTPLFYKLLPENRCPQQHLPAEGRLGDWRLVNYVAISLVIAHSALLPALAAFS